jgi:carboxylesterase type B
MLSSSGTSAGSPSEIDGSAAPIVNTECGQVQGVEKGDVNIFKAIPYAAKPIGDRRWKYAETAQSAGECWAPRVLDGTKFGSACAQLDQREPKNPQMRGSEDCLTANVYSPKQAQQWPVMVFIHGGSNLIGSSSQYDLSTVAQKLDVVAVSFNYRLNIFGYLALPALHPDGASGNYGITDCIEAIKWVRRNAVAFGGDPQRVTVVGQSSGGTNIFAMLLSTMAFGIFENAIIMSGSPKIDQTLDDAYHANSQVLGKSGCLLKDIGTCLRSIPAHKLLKIAPWNLWNLDQLDLPSRGKIMGPLVIVDGSCKIEAGVNRCHGVIQIDSWKAFHTRPLHTPKWVPTLVIGSMSEEIAAQPAQHLETQEEYEALVRRKLDRWDGTFSGKAGSTVVGRDWRINGSFADAALHLYPIKPLGPQRTYEEMVTDWEFYCGARELAVGAMWTGQAVAYLYRNTMHPTNSANYGGAVGLNHTTAHAGHTWDLHLLFDAFQPTVEVPDIAADHPDPKRPVVARVISSIASNLKPQHGLPSFGLMPPVPASVFSQAEQQALWGFFQPLMWNSTLPNWPSVIEAGNPNATALRNVLSMRLGGISRIEINAKQDECRLWYESGLLHKYALNN